MLPCFIMTFKNLMMTLLQGLMRTWRLPDFSALFMLFRASLRTLIRTMITVWKQNSFKLTEIFRLSHADLFGRKKRFEISIICSTNSLCPNNNVGYRMKKHTHHWFKLSVFNDQLDEHYQHDRKRWDQLSMQ